MTNKLLLSSLLLGFSMFLWGQKYKVNLPILDVSGEKNRQVVIAKGTEEVNLNYYDTKTH